MQHPPKFLNYRGQLTFSLARETWSASEAVREGFGLPPLAEKDSERPWQEFLDRVHKEDRPSLLQSIQSNLDAGVKPFKHSFRISPVNSDLELQVHLGGYLRCESNPQSVEFFGDITLQSETLDTTSTQEHYINLLNYTDDLLALLDKDFNYIAVNKAYCKMLGKPEDYFIGKTIHDIFKNASEYFNNNIKPLLLQCLEGKAGKFERWVEVPGHQTLYMEMNYLPYLDKAGEICGVVILGRNKTQVVKTIELLEKNKALLNRSSQIASLGGWELDVASNEIEWTDEMYAIHEVDKDYVITAQKMLNFVPEEDKAEVLKTLETGLQGKPYDQVSGMISAKGNRKKVRSVAFPLIENGQVVRLEGVLQDITELDNIQQQLQKSEEKYRNLVEETNALLWEADIKGEQISYISPRALELTGFSAEQWCTANFKTLQTHSDDQSHIKKISQQKINSLQDHVLEYRILKADKTLMWVHDDVKIIYNDKGQPKKLRGVMIDITQMKEMQSGLNKAMRSLENQKYVLDQHAIVAINDKKGKISYVNDKFMQISGYSQQELLGHTNKDLQSGLQTEEFYQELWSTINNAEVWQGEVCNKAKNGSFYWMYTTIVPVMDEVGFIEEFISVSTDITNLKSTEESLRKAQKMEAIGQLTGGVAHDFNNLLTIIIGNLELLEMAYDDDKQINSQLVSAKNAALRGSTLTRRLLNFSHQTPILGKAVNINTVLRDLEVLVSKSLTSRVNVQMELSDSLSLVEMDQGGFEDSIINLCINANDAMPLGGILRFSSCNHRISKAEGRENIILPAGNYVEIAITDTGVGMTEDVQEKIFEPYFTLKSVDKGSGLGLAMVYGFVKRSKGYITVDSSPGKGTCFRIYLPQSEQQAESRRIDGSQQSEPKTHKAIHQETILLVDDEIDIVNLNKMQLEQAGYEVITSNNADEALVALQNIEGIDLMFTDVMMPGRLNGFELADEAIQLHPDLKVLFTTGYAKAQEEVTNKTWRNNILPKPYRFDSLSVKIRELLDAD